MRKPNNERGLSIHVKKAIDKNTNCQENLERELKDLEMKRKASFREFILKQDAFIRRQLKWQSKVLAEQISSRRVSLDVSRMISNAALHQHIRRQSLSILQKPERFPSTNGASSGSTLFSKQKRLSLPALPKYEKRNRGSESSGVKKLLVGSGTSLPRMQRLQRRYTDSYLVWLN